MIHRSSAARPASALIVPLIESKWVDWRDAASIHPPMSASGAAAAETNVHQGVSRGTRRASDVGNVGASRWGKLGYHHAVLLAASAALEL
jgi:hypothetical protein